MSLKNSRLAAASAIAAAFSLISLPASAAELPRQSSFAADAVHGAPLYDSAAGDAAHYRRRHYDRHDGLDAGDVIAGLLVIGGIAAVASAASRSDRNDRGDYPPPPRPYPEDPRYRSPSGDHGPQSRGLDHAVDMCVAEVERRGNRVDSVENASRTDDGWNVGGLVSGGESFSCWIGNDGRISDVSIDQDWHGDTASYRQPPEGAAQDNQWDDDYYARARAAQHSAQPG